MSDKNNSVPWDELDLSNPNLNKEEKVSKESNEVPSPHINNDKTSILNPLSSVDDLSDNEVIEDEPSTGLVDYRSTNITPQSPPVRHNNPHSNYQSQHQNPNLNQGGYAQPYPPYQQYPTQQQYPPMQGQPQQGGYPPQQQYPMQQFQQGYPAQQYPQQNFGQYPNQQGYPMIQQQPQLPVQIVNTNTNIVGMQAQGHSFVLHLMFGWILFYIPSLYYLVSPKHYYHL